MSYKETLKKTLKRTKYLEISQASWMTPVFNLNTWGMVLREADGDLLSSRPAKAT